MAVRESSSPGAGMITGWEIHDPGRRHVGRKIAVIDAVIALVYENESVSWRKLDDLGGFPKRFETGVPGNIGKTHPPVHGYGAHDRIIAVAFSGHHPAGQALIDIG